MYRSGLETRLFEQLDSPSGKFDSLQELMEINVELDTSYHERHKETGSNQDKKRLVTGFNPSRPPQDSCFKRLHLKNSKKGQNIQASKDTPHASLLNKDNKLIGSEKERRIEEGLCTSCGGKHPIEKCFKRPKSRQGSSQGFPKNQGQA
ncbi:hypothetical protein O181_045088 [Austropuccinia psidii MF-1]|uniref:Uncharacterized protein n=1 Tax=Austropuccinia psidii MF-1 TaxID=1389203 RepID=A0A9Q3HH94_9BASI|nr:hypothetical protein [Austropuccinia psidii MF-1]